MKLTGKTALVVAPDFPFPPNHGGRLDCWATLQAMSALGITIDLVATVTELPDVESQSIVGTCVRSIKCCERSRGLKAMLSTLPFQVRSREKLRAVPLHGEYDYLFLETEYVLPILQNPSLRTRHRVLRLQNDEHVYFRELSETVGLGKGRLYYWLESWKFRRLGPAVLEKMGMTNLAFISHDEYARFVRRRPDINAIFLPPHVDASARATLPLDSKNVIVIGSLFMPNNRDGIRWYLQNVHPRLLGLEDYNFTVAGNSRGEDISWLNRLAERSSRVTVVDSPKDLRPLYERSGVFVNPMLHGAGIKLKSIEAILNGLPVVSTTVGNQGTGLQDGRHIFVCDDPASFAACVRQLLTNPRQARDMVQSAQQWLCENYNHETILTDYLLALDAPAADRRVQT